MSEAGRGLRRHVLPMCLGGAVASAGVCTVLLMLGLRAWGQGRCEIPVRAPFACGAPYFALLTVVAACLGAALIAAGLLVLGRQRRALAAVRSGQ